jgi:hypothetical protein
MPSFAKVVDVYPSANAVDCVVMSTNQRLICIPVLGNATGNTGRVDLPIPDLKDTSGAKIVRGSTGWEQNKWKSVNSDERDIIAIVDFVEGSPVCLGFIVPQLTEMTFTEAIGLERRIDRHASDVYSWIDKYGNTQWRHPNGTHASLANNPVFQDLERQDFDKKWSIKRNLASVLSYFFSLVNNGTRYFALKINPWGKTSVSSLDSIKLTATNTIGDWLAGADDPEAELSLYQASQTADVFAKDIVSLRTPSGTKIIVSEDGSVTIKGTSKVTVKSPAVKIEATTTTVTGALIVKGMTTATLGITMGPNATITGPGGGPVQGNFAITGLLGGSMTTHNPHYHTPPPPPTPAPTPKP